MKLLSIFAIVSLLGCANNAVLASTCSEESDICVCLGECPSFTNDWAVSQSGTGNSDYRSLADDEPPCVSCKSSCDPSTVNGVTVNGQSYPNPDPCPNDNSAAEVESAASSAGMFGAHYASVLLTAAAVMGGVAAL
jgi:hypothetical protein